MHSVGNFCDQRPSNAIKRDELSQYRNTCSVFALEVHDMNEVVSSKSVSRCIDPEYSFCGKVES